MRVFSFGNVACDSRHQGGPIMQLRAYHEIRAIFWRGGMKFTWSIYFDKWAIPFGIETEEFMGKKFLYFTFFCLVLCVIRRPAAE